MTPRLRVRLGRVVAAVVTVVAMGGVVACSDATPHPDYFAPVDAARPADFDYTIPPGTGAKIAADQPVSILPAVLNAKIGQTIRISNNDTVGETAGPFWVGPGKVIALRFSSSAHIDSYCQLHPSGKLIINVTA